MDGRNLKISATQAGWNGEGTPAFRRACAGGGSNWRLHARASRQPLSIGLVPVEAAIDGFRPCPGTKQGTRRSRPDKPGGEQCGVFEARVAANCSLRRAKPDGSAFQARWMRDAQVLAKWRLEAIPKSRSNQRARFRGCFQTKIYSPGSSKQNRCRSPRTKIWLPARAGVALMPSPSWLVATMSSLSPWRSTSVAPTRSQM